MRRVGKILNGVDRLLGPQLGAVLALTLPAHLADCGYLINFITASGRCTASKAICSPPNPASGRIQLLRVRWWRRLEKEVEFSHLCACSHCEPSCSDQTFAHIDLACTLGRVVMRSKTLGAHHKTLCWFCLGIAQIAVRPPHPHSNGHSGALYFGHFLKGCMVLIVI